MSASGISFLRLLILLSLRLVKSGWIDPDTALNHHSTAALTKGDTRTYNLVFSDEFETEGRSFTDGQDPRWTALDKNDYTNDALHYYKSENVRTSNGVLNITTEMKDNQYKAFNEKTKKYYLDTKHIQSGMVQGWNKFCFTGGIVEFSAKLPGKGSTGGLWPALWLLGNLARATYVGSSNWVWPFSFDNCDEGIRHQQLINACDKVSHYGMIPSVGRGAPEIDILEAMGGDPGPLPNTPIERPYFSSSLQVAPGLQKDRPLLMHQPKPGHWYEDLEYGNTTNTSLNPFFYGVTLVHKPKEYTYQSDAISANTNINESYFQSQNIYRVEWEPPNANKKGGYIRWYLNEKFLFGITGDSLNLTGALIPSEPMYLLMNVAVASSWGFPIPCPDECDCKCFDCNNPDCQCGLPTGYCDNFPSNFEIDYVRVWQAENESKHQTGCSTKDRPTELFIKGHKEEYMEDGDKEPLQSIKYGGAKCVSNLHCGGDSHGRCSERGTCVCNQGYAGSNCFAYDGFEDNPYIEQNNSLQFAKLMLPTGLVVIFSLLSIGFIASLLVNVISKHREYRAIHDDILDTQLQNNHNLVNKSTQYQSLSRPFPENKKVRTYCMIDGRLIDE